MVARMPERAEELRIWSDQGGGRRARDDSNVWDPTSEVEQSSYFWRGDPVAISPQAKSGTNDGPVAVELFCGAGGTSLGFAEAGFSVALGLDVHAPSVATFSDNHPQAAAILGDIRKVKPAEVSSAIGRRGIDVILAGVPCQGFSLNNRKRFSGDERNFLFRELIRFVTELQPRAVLLENVSGLMSSRSGEFAGEISRALREAGDYRVQVATLQAADYGVPQLRRRVCFAATPPDADFEWPRATFGPSVYVPYRTVRDAISDLPAVGPGEVNTEYDLPPLTDYQAEMRLGAGSLLNHEAPKHPPDTIAKIAATTPGAPIYPRFTQRIRLDWDRPSPTQVAGGIRPQYQFGHPSQARGETVRERCRIQSFPDTFRIHGGVVQGRVQTGNAVPPLLARAIANSFRDALRLGTGEPRPDAELAVALG
jgi:DNA (cytosine-5)-methyltransferase 1